MCDWPLQKALFFVPECEKGSRFRNVKCVFIQTNRILIPILNCSHKHTEAQTCSLLCLNPRFRYFQVEFFQKLTIYFAFWHFHGNWKFLSLDTCKCSEWKLVTVPFHWRCYTSHSDLMKPFILVAIFGYEHLHKVNLVHVWLLRCATEFVVPLPESMPCFAVAFLVYSVLVPHPTPPASRTPQRRINSGLISRFE
jgi:hypothetical protein